MTRLHLVSLLTAILATTAFSATRSALGNESTGIVGEQYEVQTFGSQWVQILPTAQVTQVDAHDQSRVDILGGVVSWADFYDSSHTNLSGDAEVSYLRLHNNATSNINGGDISYLQLYGSSRATLSAVNTLSYLLFSGQSEAHLYGSDFEYSFGHLYGKWANGSSFEFWAMDAAVIANSGADRTQPPAGLKLHVVPEPTAGALLLGCTLAAVMRRRAGA